MNLPKPLANLIDHFEKLPGIGPKTAQRLAFYLLHFPKEELAKFADALVDLKAGTRLCSICHNVAEGEVCAVCDAYNRDKHIIAIVASPMDVFALERTGYKGVYHVLHGLINPLDNIGPEDIFLHSIVGRLTDLDSAEVIIATNSSMEGESTAMYIAKLIRDSGFSEDQVKITRIARGLPVGGDIEYADDITLSRALEGRVRF